jgi:hypothetical protein
MNPRLAAFLTRLYPPAWRKRYGAEFEALLETRRGDLGTPFEVAWSAIRERIQPTPGLTEAQDLCASSLPLWWERTPGAIFCLAPVLMLAGAYAIACLILWVGWRVFLPEYDSPFGARTHGFANLYFQAGKYYYCAAPVLVGWWMEFVAIRRRVKAVWPAIGLLLVAWMGAAARIQASQATVHSGFRHIRIDFDFWLLIQNERDGMLHAATILLLGAIPYLLWRFRRVCAWVS